MQKDDLLHFGPVAATMMACVESMQSEHSFLNALGKVKRYAITGDNLALYSGAEQSIMHFEAVYRK
ncbi:MAG: META domain-containing protein [Desulfobacterales bacterium]|nr:META domain-containing protein [Desulfobacterales bacterium]